MKNNIPFTYGQSRGGHVPPYWRGKCPQSIAVQNLIIERALAAGGEGRSKPPRSRRQLSPSLAHASHCSAPTHSPVHCAYCLLRTLCR